MFRTDDIGLGQLDGSRSDALVAAVVGRGTADTVNEFLVVFHHRITWVVTGARVARVIGTEHVSISDLVLGPDSVTGQTRFVKKFPTRRHVAFDHISTCFSAHCACVLSRLTLITFKLVLVDLLTSRHTLGVVVTSTLTSAPYNLTSRLLTNQAAPS